MGWSEFENEEKESKNMNAEAVDKFCSICFQLFDANPLGEEFIGILDRQLNAPVCSPDKTASWGYFREGQNSIIRQIKNGILFHKIKGGAQS